MTIGQKLKILFADDDETFRLLVKRAIHSKSELSLICGIDFVTDGTEAVDYVLGNKQYQDRGQYPLPHVLMLDQRMTYMDGSEALAALKANPASSRIPMCILSSARTADLHDLCYGLGAAFCIAKPMDYATLTKKLELMIKFFYEVLEIQVAPSMA
jgi:CheY-like chemotaxis protein